ncbi:MAG: hypothetical protein JXA99_04310 [Candidatus Lokiarchaeota archaeon]|nr:hypothetical protein [Candidatus Lokiarchaeota archaeon]
MSRKVGGIIVSRLIVLVTLIIIPLSSFLIFMFADFSLWYSTDVNLVFWMTKVLCPLVFSLSWFFFIAIFLNRLAMSFDNMDSTIAIVPLRLKLFYGAIAIVVIFIFILPIITPFVSILSFMSVAWHVTTRKKDNWDESKTPFYTKILMVIAALLPIFCTISIVGEYLRISFLFSLSIWQDLTYHIYNISYCLCTALAVGSLFVLLANKGVSEYESIFVEKTQKKKMWYVNIVELGLFIFLLILAYGEFKIIEVFYTAGFILIIFVSIVNHFAERQKSGSYKSHILGYILAALFMGSNVLIFQSSSAEIISIISMIVLAGVFIIVFLVTFIWMDETEF